MKQRLRTSLSPVLYYNNSKPERLVKSYKSNNPNDEIRMTNSLSNYARFIEHPMSNALL